MLNRESKYLKICLFSVYSNITLLASLKKLNLIIPPDRISNQTDTRRGLSVRSWSNNGALHSNTENSVY